jgi:hypothetical protein
MQRWSDVPILKVRQPYAAELVAGVKDVENRTWSLRATTSFPVWVIVASCRARATAAAIADARRRRTAAGDTPRAGDDAYAYGCLVGMVLVQSCDDTHASPWYVTGHKAWVISDAIQFPRPIDMDADDKMQIIAYMRHRMCYHERIVRALHDADAYHCSNAALPQ